MDKFTARNSTEIREDEEGGFTLEHWRASRTYLQNEHVHALREFFQHERDKELGRWRWPENPDFVVYPKEETATEPESGVRVVHEITGRSRDISRAAEGACDATLSAFGRAARAYFAAHPEPKPWHDAKPGEVWVLTGAGGLEQPWRRMDAGRWLSCTTGMVEYNDEHAIAGRRIWPEDDK